MSEEELLEFDLEGADGLEPAGEEDGIQIVSMEEVEAAAAVLQHPHYYAHRFVPAHSSNYSGGRFGRPIQYMICHIVQGSYGSCINWFQNPQANVSSTYVVSREGHTTQMVSERNTPWTNGNSEANMRSVTIEHEGWESQGGPSEPQLHASSKIFAGTAIRHNIPLDFQHFFGHTHVRGASRPCPGPWPWQRQLDLIKQYVRGSANPSPPGKLYRVQTGAMRQKGNADRLAAELKSKGFEAIVVSGGGWHRVQVGAYSEHGNSQVMAGRLRRAGYEAVVV